MRYNSRQQAHALMAIKVEKNQIRGSLWGITVIGTAQADFGGGSLGSIGENV